MIFFIIKHLFQGKSVMRALMNWESKKYTLNGKILDVGGGKSPSYYEYLNRSQEVEIINLDLKNNLKSIDLEIDSLPASDKTIDQVLLFNILEHIYNHDFLISEAFRVLSGSGSIIGFVPFFINVHPDPHDYFRYTKEALWKIFSNAGFNQIEIKEIGVGPFIVNFNNIIFLWPRILRVFVFPIYYFLDLFLIKIKPSVNKRFPLGYFFVIKK